MSVLDVTTRPPLSVINSVKLFGNFIKMSFKTELLCQHNHLRSLTLFYKIFLILIFSNKYYP